MAKDWVLAPNETIVDGAIYRAARREISTNYSELYDPTHGHGNPLNTSWVVIRDDHPSFARLAAANPDAVRDVEDARAYGNSDAYDYNGPL